MENNRRRSLITRQRYREVTRVESNQNYNSENKDHAFKKQIVDMQNIF